MKNNTLLVFMALLTVTTPAMAYIDPGSGSAILSAIIGFFIAVSGPQADSLIGIYENTYIYDVMMQHIQ